MRSDIITISSDLSGRDAAMKAAERFAAYHSLTGRDAMHIRLLTEETVCLVHGILDDFSGTFWLESDETNDGLHCRICLSADKHVNKAQEDMILSVSTSGKNESSKGILGKLREIVRSSIQEGSEEDSRFMRNMTDAWWNMGASESSLASADPSYWSLQRYRQNLSGSADERKEEWDELEKSIIAKLADEVKVWLKTDSTDVVIEKSFIR